MCTFQHSEATFVVYIYYMMQCVHVCRILVLKSITAFVMCWTLSCKWRWALLSCLMLNRNMRASSLGFFAVAWLTTPMQGIYFTMIPTEHSTNLAFWFCFASSTLQPHAGRSLDLILVFMHLLFLHVWSWNYFMDEWQDLFWNLCHEDDALRLQGLKGVRSHL